MEKLVKIQTSYDNHLEIFNEKYLNKGWTVKETISFNKQNKELLFLLEKHSRKEKLEYIDNLNN